MTTSLSRGDVALGDGLAVQGGTPVRATPWPTRHLFGQAEKEAAMRLFDQAIATGTAFGYQGPEEEAYCGAFAAWLGGGHADAVNSGTSAVYVALRSLDLEPGSEVIAPPITDQGGFMPVSLLNLIPVPADSAPGQLNTSAMQIAAHITPRTRAILVAHLAGTPCDMDPILQLARQHKLRVVEDCAQAHGATYHGKKAGTLGDVAAFSTMSGKHHATAAQGGVVYTRDEMIFKRVRQAADRGKPYGEAPGMGNVMASLNLNSNELACAVGRVQFEKLPGMIARRQAFAREVIDGSRGFKSLSFIDALPQSQSVYWFLLAKLDLDKLTVDKVTFTKALAAEGIPAGEHYWHCPVDAPWYQNQTFAPQNRRFSSADLPNAARTRLTHFPIGMHESCTSREAQDILKAIAKVEAVYAH